jgi:quercetin dioxygenase-like cupin family protein
MKTSLIVAAVAGLALAGGLVEMTQAARPAPARKNKKEAVEPASDSKKEAVYASVDQAAFKEKMPGVSIAVLWGDPEKGAHGAFTKFAPGYDAGMHTHSSDVWLVVIKGAYLYKDDAGEKRVGAPGDFIRIPAGHKHWSGGDKAEGAVFYQEGSGKFDLIPVKDGGEKK